MFPSCNWNLDNLGWPKHHHSTPISDFYLIEPQESRYNYISIKLKPEELVHGAEASLTVMT